jgi:hypothetical protein
VRARLAARSGTADTPHTVLEPRAMLVLLLALWCAALLVAGIGFRATYGEWPGVADWLSATLLLAVFALPASVGTLFGMPLGPWTGAAFLLWLGFWSLTGVLHAAALLTGRRRYAALLAAVLLPAAWLWTVHAAGMMGI